MPGFKLLRAGLRLLLSVVGITAALLVSPEWRKMLARGARPLLTAGWRVCLLVLRLSLVASAIPGGIRRAFQEAGDDIRAAGREGRAAAASGGASLLFDYRPEAAEVTQRRTSPVKIAVQTGGLGLLFDWSTDKPTTRSEAA
jgi:hypothetical protein